MSAESRVESPELDDNNEGNPVEDKHKETVGGDDSQMSSVESSATLYSLFEELIDEMENYQSPLVQITDPLRWYMEKYPRLAPERDEGKETEASFPQAWSMIDFPNFMASLDEAEKMFPPRSDPLLVKLIQSFGSAFSGASFAWEDISKDPFSSTLDVSLCPGYPKLVDWIVNHGPTSTYLLGKFMAWGFGHILDSLFHYRWKKGDTPTDLSDVSIFAALALVLRSHPNILPTSIRLLEEINLWYQKKGAVTYPISVWMVHQVSYGNIHAALFSWIRYLLPQLQVVPQSREFILPLVEKIFEHPGAQTQLVESPTLFDNQLFPLSMFEILLRVTFLATSEEDTRRLLKIYTSLKEVALACALLHKQAPRYMFTMSLTLAGEGNPGLAKEAVEIAIWCMKTVDCWDDWYDLCKGKLEVSVALLKALTEKKNLNLNLLPSLSNKHFIQQMFTLSLILAGEGIPVIAKEAAKICIWCLTQHVNCWSHWIDIYTNNLEEASVVLLKALVDEWPALSLKLPSSGKPFIQQIFTVALGLAGKENHVLAKEATEIAIWSLTQNVDCWTLWKNLCCKENPKASVVLLKTLVEKWNALSPKLSYSSTVAMEVIIEKMATSSLNIARQGISMLHTGNPFLLGKASQVAIWSLIEIVDCCRDHWRHLYMKILEDSGTLLNDLIKKYVDLSLKQASSSLKSGGAPEREAKKQVFQQIFTFSLRLAGKKKPILAKEAIAISIWSLTKNFDCCTHWDNLYEENIKASVALLKKLVHEWSDHSLKLSLSPSDTLTLSQTIQSFRLKNQKAIAEGGANGYLFKDADKFCKVILGRLSRGSCSLKCACVTSVVLVAALLTFYLVAYFSNF